MSVNSPIDLSEIWAKAVELRSAPTIASIDPDESKLISFLDDLNHLTLLDHPEAKKLAYYLAEIKDYAIDEEDCPESQQYRLLMIGLTMLLKTSHKQPVKISLSEEELKTEWRELAHYLRYSDPDFANWFSGPSL